LVRHYYLRNNPEQGDLQVNLIPKAQRTRASHAIALDVRQRLSAVPRPPGTVVRADQQNRLGKAGPPEIRYHGQPADESHASLLWDGEWEVTYVTFRDMGAAFMVAILGIYLLVVAQFGSFRLPLVVLIPVPLTLIGIVLGHWLLHAPFTATSMIGFIALAGIIVRNSILLVDFIRRPVRRGCNLARRVARGGGDPVQAHLSDRGRGDDRRRLYHYRPDLSGPGDFAGVRSRLVDPLDRACDPGGLCLAARRPPGFGRGSADAVA
jgi:AcrB/AcrD/AcrF family